MKLLNNILKAPIRKTVITLGISVMAYVLFAWLSLYLLRVMCADVPATAEVCPGTSLQSLTSQILGDFQQLARITFVFSVIVLISQLVYRLISGFKK
jgi:hypothetical protein